MQLTGVLPATLVGKVSPSTQEGRLLTWNMKQGLCPEPTLEQGPSLTLWLLTAPYA